LRIVQVPRHTLQLQIHIVLNPLTQGFLRDHGRISLDNRRQLYADRIVIRFWLPSVPLAKARPERLDLVF
jgi:hypothetical protein